MTSYLSLIDYTATALLSLLLFGRAYSADEQLTVIQNVEVEVELRTEASAMTHADVWKMASTPVDRVPSYMMVLCVRFSVSVIVC